MRVIDVVRVHTIWKMILIGLFLGAYSVAGNAADWEMDTERSKLEFQLQVGGNSLKGAFKDFQAQIDFDQQNPSSGSIVVTVETGSIATGNSQGDTIAKAVDWLASDPFPVVRFQSTSIKSAGANSFVASGDLLIKGISVPVDLTFNLELDGINAVGTGSASLSRSDFGVGGTQSTNLPVEDGVGIEFVIYAKPH